jgi:hypothetical protein
VHFDLHGVIESTEGTSYLLFNDPAPGVDTTRRRVLKWWRNFLLNMVSKSPCLRLASRQERPLGIIL